MQLRLACVVLFVGACSGGSKSQDFSVTPDQSAMADMATTTDLEPVADLEPSADLEPADVMLSTSALTFDLPCNATGTGTIQAAAKSFTITNNGSTDLTWQAALKASPSPFALASLTGIVKAGTTSSPIVVTPAAVTLPASTAANAYGDTLTITTDVTGDPVHAIKLNQTATGAILGFSTTTVGFGTQPVTTPTATTTTKTFSVGNTGNAAANTVTLTVIPGAGNPTDAAYLVASNTTDAITNLAAAGSANVMTSFTPGSMPSTDAVASTATIAMSVDSMTALCAPLPAALQESGAGSVGTVGTSSLLVQFTSTASTQNSVSFPAPSAGNVYCGTGAPPQTITISNTSTTTPFNITAFTFGKGSSSPYGFASTPTLPMTVAAGGMASFSVVTTAIPATYSFASPVDYNDTLTVTLDTGDAPVFTLQQAAYGAELTNPFPAPTSGTATLTFPATPDGSTSVVQMNVTNIGSMPGQFLVTNINQTAFSFDGTSSAPVALAPNGATTSWNAYFTPALVQSYSGGSATLTTPATWLCGPSPQQPTTAFAMSGTGTAASNYSVSPSSIKFANAPCGQTPTQTATVTITNAAVLGTTYTAVVNSATNGSSFALSASNGLVPGKVGTTDGSTSFTVTAYEPPTVTQASGSLHTSFTATLQVVVGTGNAATTVNIPISETSQGLVLAFNPASVTVKNAASANKLGKVNAKLTNTGTASGSVTLTLGTATTTSGTAVLGLNSGTTTTYTSTIAAYGQGGAQQGVPFTIVSSSPQGTAGTDTVQGAGTSASVPVCQTPTALGVTLAD